MLGRLGPSVVGLVCVAAVAAPAGAVTWSALHYGTRDGLPSPYIKAVVEDDSGFLWLATDGGLVRFDGSTFTPFLDAPSGRFLKALARLPDGRLLVAGDSGVGVVEATSHSARIRRLVSSGDSPTATTVHYPKALFVDSRGRAWVSEPEAVVLLLDGGGIRRYAFPASARSTSFVRSFSLAEDGLGRIWAASRPGALFVLDAASDRFRAVPLPRGAPRISPTSHLAAVAPDVLWQGTTEGVVEIRLAKASPAVVSARRHEGFGNVSWVCPAAERVLVATYGGPTFAVRPDRASERTAVSSPGIVQHALVARSGDLYLSTDEGLVVLQRQPFELLALPRGDLSRTAESFALGPGGVLYACDRRSVYRLVRQEGVVRSVRIFENPQAYVLGLLGDGRRVWAAGLGRLFLFENDRLAWALDLSDRGTYVVGLAADGDGSVWIAQFDSTGALRLEPDGRLVVYGVERGLDGRILALRVGADGTLYAAGAGRSSYLFRYDRARDRFVGLSLPLPFEPVEPFDVRDVDADRVGRIWLASTAGLLEQDAGSVRRVDLGPELGHLPTHSLGATSDGRIWVATSAGLVGFDPAKGEYAAYDENDGLPSKNVSMRGIFPYGDELFVATTRGVARASLPDLAPRPPGPPVVVELRVDDAPVTLERSGSQMPVVPHGALISARCASPGGGERVFQWRVEGLDRDWRAPTSRGELIVATPGAGQYRILVRAALRGSNVWGGPATLGFRVAPAWYARWWAWPLLATGLAGLVGLSWRVAAARARRDEDRLRALVEERTRELREANVQLAASNSELERFAYTVSHDLKSPLVTIRGFLGFLEPSAQRGDFERLRADISRIERASDRMTTLLDELLRLSRVGRARNRPETVPFAAIAREAATLAGGSLAAHGLRVDIDEELPAVRGDRLRLVELVQNLLENAAKFAGPGPDRWVVVGSRAGPDGPTFYVRDNGIGIDPAYLEKIFGLFEKLDARSEGTGLGLAIARRIAELHGGRLWAESEGPGRGSTFCFTLDECRVP
jgi:signal transduction histidine kinase/streptogramin lyase